MKKTLKIAALAAAAAVAFTVLAAPRPIEAEGAVPRVIYMRLTAYASTPDETAWNPFWTADGTHVADGIVANNTLPFGTRIMIPSLFGDKVFTVHDRMAKRFQKTVDIWMHTKGAAIRFGVEYANILILPPLAQTTTTKGLAKI